MRWWRWWPGRWGWGMAQMEGGAVPIENSMFEYRIICFSKWDKILNERLDISLLSGMGSGDRSRGWVMRDSECNECQSHRKFPIFECYRDIDDAVDIYAEYLLAFIIWSAGRVFLFGWDATLFEKAVLCAKCIRLRFFALHYFCFLILTY